MINLNTKAGRQSESGNVLFLILIAVALFAALSYAVTQSSRSGGGDANSETSLVNSATITQYPASVRTAIIRQIVSKGVSAEDLEFNAPSDFGDCTGAPTSYSNCVFHPQGGAATYTLAPAEVMANTLPGTWVFNGQNEINLVGTTSAGASNTPTETTADIIAFLPGIKKTICEKIDQQLGIGAVPSESSINVTFQKVNGTAMVDSGGGGLGTIGGTGDETLNGQGFGCFSQGSSPNEVYTYYHVLIEQ